MGGRIALRGQYIGNGDKTTPNADVSCYLFLKKIRGRRNYSLKLVHISCSKGKKGVHTKEVGWGRGDLSRCPSKLR